MRRSTSTIEREVARRRRRGVRRCPRRAGAPACRCRHPAGCGPPATRSWRDRPSPLQRGQARRLCAPRPSHSRHGREKIMWPRLPRTLPVPPQRGHGTGPKVTSPAPPQPAQASKRTSWTRRVAPGIDSSKLTRVACSRSSPRGAPRARAARARRSRGSRPPDAHARLEVEALEAALGRGRHGLRPLLAAVVGGAALRVAEDLERARRPPDTARRPPDRPGSRRGGARATASGRRAGSRRRPRPAVTPRSS